MHHMYSNDVSWDEEVNKILFAAGQYNIFVFFNVIWIKYSLPGGFQFGILFLDHINHKESNTYVVKSCCIHKSLAANSHNHDDFYYN